MSATIPDAQFRKSDFPSDGLGSQDALDKFFQPLNSFTKAVQTSINGPGATVGASVSETRTFTVTTPATDWITLALLNSWVNRSSSGAPPASYRIWATGDVELRGQISGGTIGGTSFASLPTYAPDGIITMPCVSYNTGAGTYVIGRFQIDATGSLQPQNGHNSLFCLDGLRWIPAPGNRTSGAYSCFPVSLTTKVTRPTSVTVQSVADKSTNAQVPALGGVSWTYSSPGAIQITNIPGLLLNRSYTISVNIAATG